MLRNPIFAAVAATGYLLVYCLFLAIENADLRHLAFTMFYFSPVIMIWLTYTVIRYGKYEGGDLKEGEEFGYSDRVGHNLGTF